MEEPGRLQSRVSRSWTQLSNFTFTFHFHALEKEMATYSSVLAGRIPGMGEPGGLPSTGSHRVRHDLVTEPACTHEHYITAAAKLLQSCPTLCDPIDGIPPGSADPGILQARTLEWVAISISNA